MKLTIYMYIIIPTTCFLIFCVIGKKNNHVTNLPSMVRDEPTTCSMDAASVLGIRSKMSS